MFEFHMAALPIYLALIYSLFMIAKLTIQMEGLRHLLLAMVIGLVGSYWVFYWLNLSVNY